MISRVNRKRQRLIAAHVQTPALLTQTLAALKDGEKKRVSLEEELQVNPAEKESYSERKEGLKKEAGRRARPERNCLTSDTTGRQKPCSGERESWRIRSRTKNLLMAGLDQGPRGDLNPESLKYILVCLLGTHIPHKSRDQSLNALHKFMNKAQMSGFMVIQAIQKVIGSILDPCIIQAWS